MKLSGWGRYPSIVAQPYHLAGLGSLRSFLDRFEADELITHGLGRSYGDSALSRQVVMTRRFNKLLAFDECNGVLTCEAGASLDKIIRTYLPRGWFPAILPGTRFVTVGGAISSDIHGKNHHLEGCFSTSVLGFELMLNNGRILWVDPKHHPDWFQATCGGMGLTGVILKTLLQLRRVSSGYVLETTHPTRDLDETLALFELYRDTPYSVAWIDCLAKGSRLGRSVLILGDHAIHGPLNVLPPARSLSLCMDLPGFVLNRHSIALFNQVYYRQKSRASAEHRVPWYSFFCPLDQILHWNRMYGRNGFIQYQMVFPKASGREGLRTLLQRIATSGLGSFLAVLKLLGPQNDNWLSFPLEGYTLALDFKIQKNLFELIQELDRIVLDFGGRLYLAKDACMTLATFRSSYPKWQKFVQFRKEHDLSNLFVSLQSKRLGL